MSAEEPIRRGRGGARGLAALLGAALWLAARGAGAQPSVTAEAGLGELYKPFRWLPIAVTLANSGAPARVEVRARFESAAGGPMELRLPARELPAGARQRHRLYLEPPLHYARQPLVVELYRDGRRLASVRPALRQLGEGDVLLVAFGPLDSVQQLKALDGQRLRGALGAFLPGRLVHPGPGALAVAVETPDRLPDRWQGLEMADLVLLGRVSEQEAAPEQWAALRDYVVAGGTLVVTGGLNWNRLASPAFAELLPVRVSGSRTLPIERIRPAAGARRVASAQALARAFEGLRGVCVAATGTPKPGAETLLEAEETPILVRGTLGSGQVFFLAVDPSLPPLSGAAARPELWGELLRMPPGAPLLRTVAAEEPFPPESLGLGGGAGRSRLADAPYAVPQLDIPAFYVVALFLLAYIVVLVPVNYMFLKARDRKEYAWLTIPAIVALFSGGAYLIGYGLKGGRALLVRVGIVEARTGERAAPNLFYVGLFSPRKTEYAIRLAAEEGAGAALLSEPAGGASSGLRIVEDEERRLEGFGVDMWAMRVFKSEGITPLGGGIVAALRHEADRIVGTVENRSPHHVEECHLLLPEGILPVGELPAGGTARVDGRPVPSRGGISNRAGLSFARLLPDPRGSREEQRIRRALLEALPAADPLRFTPQGVLVGWIRENPSLLDLRIDGRRPRERVATLLLVHLGAGEPATGPPGSPGGDAVPDLSRSLPKADR